MFTLISFLLVSKYYKRIVERFDELLWAVILCFLITVTVDLCLIDIIMENL